MELWERTMENLAVTLPQTSFWRGRRVLVTGHTGFKGSWLVHWLHRIGAQVTGIALPPSTSPNLYSEADVDTGILSHIVDIRDAAAISSVAADSGAEIVIHLAAQALVREGYHSPLATHSTNIIGTANVLEAIRKMPAARVAIIVTTDKVYKQTDSKSCFKETDELGGHDPYSSSKAAAEIVAASYRDSYLQRQGVAVATARAGNVIGGGDWSADRLLPDAVRAWSRGEAVEVRRPEAVRPWQHVLEPLSGYLTLAERLWTEPALAGAYNFGPKPDGAASVRSVVELARSAYGRGDVLWGGGDAGPHESAWLSLDPSKAQELLGVQPRWTLEEAVSRTMHWYRSAHAGGNPRLLCDEDINRFMEVP